MSRSGIGLYSSFCTGSCDSLLRFLYFRRTFHGFEINILHRTILHLLVLFGTMFPVLQVLEFAKVSGVDILRILQSDNILAAKLLVRNQVAPHLWLYI